MCQFGTTYHVTIEIKRYNLEVLGRSVARRRQSGQKRFNSGEMLYSGHEEENAPHSEGVAPILPRSAQRALIVYMGGTWTTNHYSKFQNKGKENQNECDTLLRTYK